MAKKTVTAEEIMTREPATVPIGGTVGQALAVLQELDVRHLPVIDERGDLVGMVSDRDFRGLPVVNLLEGNGRVRLDAPIAGIMSGGVYTVDADDPLGDVIDTMLDEKVGALPVLDSEGRMIGIVSYVDLLRAVRELV